VEIMRPALGKVLPGMRGGVAGDVVLLPIDRRTFGIVPAERLVVVLPLVAEEYAKVL
jgi:hypothetical protein